MFSNRHDELAKKYYSNHIISALIPGSRLSNVLAQLDAGRSISETTQEFLRQQGLLILLRYVKNEISFAEFLILAEQENIPRIRAAKEKAEREEAEEAARTARGKLDLQQLQAEREKEEMERATRMQHQSLFQKYGLPEYALHGTPEKADFPKLLDILKKVDSSVRLEKEELVWLLANKKAYFTEHLQAAHHKNEAEFYASEFKQRKDPWLAVNASGHYRKCREAETAERILSTIALSKIKDAKLKSALCTTHGGVKRDLGKWDEALNLGEQAHLLTPKDFRPCTLLGAVNIEIGNYELGQAWYAKAVERGYTEKAVDDDLRRIFKRLEKSKQDKLRDYLLRTDPVRYSWASKKSREK